jgi:hypothetical protein
VDLGEKVAGDTDAPPLAILAPHRRDVVFPLDLVAHLILVPHPGGVPPIERLVGHAERDRP